MTPSAATTIGFIGAGNIGGQVARVAITRGYQVVLSNSRGPETLADLVTELGDAARAGTPQEAATAGDLVVVTVPLHAYTSVPVDELAGKVVIDTNNYYPQRDGQIAELDEGSATSSELLQRHLTTSHVVKGFNHIPAADLTTDPLPSGAADRRALAIAGDDTAAKATVTTFLDDLGFDTVDLGSLADSWRIEPGTPGYGPRMTATELEQALAAAERPSAG